jgi:hypothetical protein
MTSSKGRHGGGGGKTDKAEAANQRAEAGRNTDVDSLRHARDKDEAEGHTSGRK